MTPGPSCWVCGTPRPAPFFDAPGVPVHCNVLWPTPEAARRAPRGDIRLGVCHTCGMIGNVAFTDAETQYDATYENSLHFSGTFQDYATALADDLVERHGLHGKTVLEIGCGKGEFLRLLCAEGRCRGVGIDASYQPSAETTAPYLTFVRAPFRADDARVAADLIVCRHVLEHLPDPLGFAREIARAAARRERCVVFIEVPNALYTLRDLGIWDIIYEHCLYFSAAPLARLFRAVGLAVRQVQAVYGDQFLALEAVAGGPPEAPELFSDTPALAEAFASHYRDKTASWRARLAEWRATGARVALWGSGSKGVTFLNTVAAAGDVEHVVDINPRKHGRYVAGTGHRVVPPQALRDAPPDHVLLMNPLYRNEVGRQLGELGLAAAIVAV